MTRKSIHSRSTLRQLLEYRNGKLFWLSRPPEMFATLRAYRSWNSRFAGTEAFTALSSDGYKVGTLLGRREYAHRVIWAMHHDEWPEELDHINGSRASNEIDNLRSVGRQGNRMNVKLPTNNRSGVIGVRKIGESWQAKIQFKGKDRYLGRFGTLDEAAEARKSAEIELGFHPNHGRM